jgi:hypothetical protein
MSQNSGSRAGVVALGVSVMVALAVSNVVLLIYIVQRMTATESPDLPIATLRAISERTPELLAAMAGVHLIALVVIVLALASGGTHATAPAAVNDAAEVDMAAPGLRLLALLQAEGRLIDFLEEDIDAYSDTQVGTAVRSIHAGCRKALHERMHIERIYDAEDGSTIEVAAGFDPAAVRLTGNVHGQPPFRGTLQHTGWRATDVRLPEPSPGVDHRVLAPAEVEIP